ncbi:MAG: excisionase [Citromicrobium sp.]|nr:MAG: excisionase [Citromicrobium sp.]
MELITVAETMRRLALGRTKVYQLLAEGRLRSVKIGRARRILSESVNAIAESAE